MPELSKSSDKNFTKQTEENSKDDEDLGSFNGDSNAKCQTIDGKLSPNFKTPQTQGSAIENPLQNRVLKPATPTVNNLF